MSVCVQVRRSVNARVDALSVNIDSKVSELGQKLDAVLASLGQASMLADPKRPLRVSRGARSGHKEHPPRDRHRRRHKSRDEELTITPARGEGLSSIEHLESTLARMGGGEARVGVEEHEQHMLEA